VTATQAGVYHWLAIFSGDSNNTGPVDSGCASEPVTITAQPTIDTDQSPKTGNVGDPISDSASLHNTSNLDGTGTVKIYLYAPGETCHADGSGGTLEQTYSNVTTNGPFTAGPVTATQAGVYHWLAIFSGDSNNTGPVDSGCASEPVTITAQPTITTSANPTSGTAPVALNDSATLHNTSNLVGGTITFYLFAPGVTCNTDGTGSIFSQTVSVTAGNEGPYNTSGGPSVSTAGTYQWVAIYSGDANNAGTDSGCGTEPVVVTTPGQGCTPGFWKNHTGAWNSTTDSTVSHLLPFLVSPFGYDATLTNFNNQPFFGYGTPQTNPGIFGLPGGPYRGLKSTLTLIGALKLGGGGFSALARHGTAALLSSGSVQYPYTPTQVLNGVRNAFLANNANQVSATFPDGVLTDLTAANGLNEQACPSS
jgi:hypothetical protein